MITIHAYGVAEDLCSALSDSLSAGKVKHTVCAQAFDALSEPARPSAQVDVALIDLNGTGNTPAQMGEQLDAQDFILPTVLLWDDLIESTDQASIREPIVDVLHAASVPLIANSIVREARLQQYKRLINQTRLQTRDEHQRLKNVLDHTEDGVVVIHNGKYVETNQAYLRLFDLEKTEATPGLPVREFLTNVDPAEQTCSISCDECDIKCINTPNASLDALQNDVLHSVHIQKRNGESFITTLLKTSCIVRGMKCDQIMIHNPNAWSDIDRNFLDLRSQDVETGLLNRRFFLERMESIFNHRDNDSEGALAFILVDHFRDIREDCGIRTGDSILHSIAQSIQELATENDILCRFGDHAFALYCNELSQDEFIKRCDEIRTRIDEQLFGKHDAFVKLTISIGISFLNRHVLNVQQLISQADNACDTACSKGGNKIQVFKTVPIAVDTLTDQQSHIESIKTALQQNRLHAMFQPIVNLVGDEHENYAVLLRMLDVDNSHILPDQFIQAAEQSGLICDLDEWVMTHCIGLLKSAEPKVKQKRRFFLKISIQTVKRPEFVQALLASLKFHHLDGSQLVFQLDYAEALPENTTVMAFVQSVKRQSKCLFAFDHVGFGEISDQTIQTFSVDFIKIDGTFTRNLVNNPAYQNTVRQILAVTRRNHIPAIAKSVENANTLASLCNLGVDMVQGYFLQRPSDDMAYDFDSVAI